MSALTDPAVALPDRLRTVFDAQVMNYGAYNLVCTTGSVQHRNPAVTEVQGEDPHHFLVGYRRGPEEMIVAPFAPDSMQPRGLPISIDNTNMVRARALSDHAILLETTSGSVFRLEISPLLEIRTELGAEVLEQEADVEDFLDYLNDRLDAGTQH